MLSTAIALTANSFWKYANYLIAGLLIPPSLNGLAMFTKRRRRPLTVDRGLRAAVFWREGFTFLERFVS